MFDAPIGRQERRYHLQDVVWPYLGCSMWFLPLLHLEAPFTPPPWLLAAVSAVASFLAASATRYSTSFPSSVDSRRGSDLLAVLPT